MREWAIYQYSDMTVVKNKQAQKVTVLLAVILVLSAPNFIPIIHDGGISFFSEIAAYGLGFWLLWFAVFKYLHIGFWIALPACLWWTASVYLRLVYATPVTPEFLGMALDTNAIELVNFLSAFGYWLVLATVMAAVIGVAAALGLCRKRWAWIHRSRWWVLTLVLMTSLLLMAMYMFEASNEPAPDTSTDPFHQLIDSYWLEKWGKVYPLDLPISWYRIARDQRRIDDLRAKIKVHDFEARVVGHQPDVVVLVIGESSRRDRWGNFGYGRQTTPHLAKLEKVVTLNDVVSISTATRSAVPSLVSRRPFYGPGGAAEQAEPSILKAFAEVGYRTYWISNQTASGFYDTPIAFYARDADEVVYKNPASYAARGSLDGELLPIIDEALQKISGKKFIVVHTMGSHFNYAFRYSKDFAVYQPAMGSDYVSKKMANNAASVNNAYDNTIVYTDFFLGRLISMLQERNATALLAYASDHGEDLWEPNCNDAENGRRSFRSFEIPALVWFSDAAAETMRDRMAQLSLNAGRPAIGKALPQTLLDLAGIEVGGVATDSFLRADQPDLPRMVYAHGGWVDFDVAKRKNACHITP